MPKGKTNRDLGLNHINGKGSKTRVTDVKSYRKNFDEINWGPPARSVSPYRTTLREIEEEHEWRRRL